MDSGRPDLENGNDDAGDAGPRPQSTVHRARDLWLVAVIAAIANFLYLHFSNGDYFYPDSITYLTPARNLLHGLGYITEPGIVETMRTPGYPLFLLPFLALSSSVVPIVIAQHLMNIALTIGTYLLAMHVTARRRIAILAAILFALDTPSIHHANRVLSEALFTLLLFVVFALALRLMHRATLPLAAITGVLAGALALVRPVAIVYFAILAICLARPMRAAIALLVCGALLPLGWSVRNKIETHVFTLTTVSGINMLQHRAAAAIAIFDDYEFPSALADRQDEVVEAANDEIQRREHVQDAGDLDPAVVARYYEQIGRRIALQHPLGLAMVMVRGVLINLFDSNWGAMSDVSRIPESIVQLALNAWTAAAMAFACVGVFVLFRINRRFTILLLATIAYFIIISAGSEAEARFRVPVMPLIAIAAATGLQRSFSQI